MKIDKERTRSWREAEKETGGRSLHVYRLKWCVVYNLFHFLSTTSIAVKMKNCLFIQAGLTTIAVYSCTIHPLMLHCCTSRAHDDVISHCRGRKISNQKLEVDGPSVYDHVFLLPFVLPYTCKRQGLPKVSLLNTKHGHGTWSQTHAWTINEPYLPEKKKGCIYR